MSIVIPAKAGIQQEYISRSDQNKDAVPLLREFIQQLDSGLRRNDMQI